MVKNKRFLIALILVIALTVPRFAFVRVEEDESEYFNPDGMPDSLEDMADWRAWEVSVCDKCVADLTEMVYENRPTKYENRQLFYIKEWGAEGLGTIDRRCPVHPDVTLHTPPSFKWGGTSSTQGTYEVPENLIPLYPKEIVDSPETNLHIFICPECQKTLSEKFTDETPENYDEGELIKGLQNLAQGDTAFGWQERLFYSALTMGKSYCTFHKDQELRHTAQIPVHPVVIKALPEDTKYISRIYLSKNPQRSQRIDMTIVTQGRDKRSIHRPERCLTMQGFRLDHAETINIPVPDSEQKSLAVRKLRMVRTRLGTGPGAGRTEKLIVFYWYASTERITESNFLRLAYTTWDRMVMGRNYRWSYVLLHSQVLSDNPEDEKRALEGLYSFMQQFFPIVEKKE